MTYINDIRPNSPRESHEYELEKRIIARKNMSFHYQEYLALGKEICVVISFKDYLHYKYTFWPQYLDMTYFERSKLSKEKPSCSTPLSKREEKRTKCEASSDPFAYSGIMRLLGFSLRNSKDLDPNYTKDKYV